MRLLFIIIVFLLNVLYAQENSSYSRAYIGYSAELITYQITENEAYSLAKGTIPSPVPFILNNFEIGYCSFSEWLLLGIYGGISLGKPTGIISVTKSNINFEIGLHGESIDIYTGLKGFVLINLTQKGILVNNLSDTNVSYKNSQIFGYAVDIGIRAFLTKKLMLTAEGAINFFINGNIHKEWYSTGVLVPYNSLIFDTYSFKFGFGIIL
ncbi:hypothetical protein [Rosettibacter firmus]|uniref:hypothetical protein n=1 Tax=Rosettibacter firmus TaxID=3111522 RepID=UPI00336BC284